MHARSLILSLTLVAAPAAAQTPAAADTAVPRTLGPAPERITLADAIKRAVQVQPATVQARGNITTADAQQRSAYGAFLPSINANSNATSSYTDGNDAFVARTRKSSSFGLSGSMDLWTGLRRGADISAANANDRSAAAGLVNARFSVIQQTTGAYLDALANAQTVDVRATSVRRAMEQLKVSIAKLRAGSTTRSDSLRSEVNLGNARVALINAEIAQATAEATLGRLIGAAGRVAAIDDTNYTTIRQVDTTGIRAEAQASSPQVVSADAQADAARAQVRSAYSAYSPTLSLSGNWNFNGSDTASFGTPLFMSRSISLGLSWPLFNRFQREQTIATRHANADLAEATAADTKRGVDATATQLLAQMAAAHTRIDITNASVQAATEDLRVVGERYRLGAATIVDLLTSQEALTQAEIDAVNARFDYLRAKSQIEALIGRTL